MKRLNELYDCSYDIPINGIKINSKEIVPGDLFICTSGVTADRHDYVEDAILHGAVAIVASKKINVSVPVVYVPNTNEELPLLMSRFYDFPEKKLSLIGVTGTNGKTTVAQMVQQLLGEEICGYIGTNGIRCSKFKESIRNTTPDTDRLFPYFRRFVDAGCSYLSMETSSEAFFRHRLDYFTFPITVLTNITEDHLNIHKTIENYIDCKCQLFRQTSPGGYSILNLDDAHYSEVRQNCKENVLTYGKSEEADLQIVSYQLKKDCTEIQYTYQGRNYSVCSPFLGDFNVSNLSAALLVWVALGNDFSLGLERVAFMEPILGRLELVDFHQPYQIILDYAHTPDALNHILNFLNQVKTNRIITVTGSAGGRQREKRPMMGKVVLEKSDYVIFTMDDPRNESVDEIIDDLIGNSKLTNYERVIDRTIAIERAFEIAEKGDIVLIAGKGRDNYMALGDEYLPYCDYDVIEEYFKTKKDQD